MKMVSFNRFHQLLYACAGVLAGHWLRSSYTQNKKVLGLLDRWIYKHIDSTSMGLIFPDNFPVMVKLLCNACYRYKFNIAQLVLLDY